MILGKATAHLTGTRAVAGDTARRAAASTLLMPPPTSGDEERDDAAEPGFDCDGASGGREHEAGDAVDGLVSSI